MIDHVERYLALRRALRFQLQHLVRILRAFARFAASRGERYVVAATAVEWAALAPTADRRHRRLQAVAALARHLRAEDGRHQVPPSVFPRCRPSRTPFIFADSEVAALLKAAASIGPRGSLRAATLSTLLGLLACTGLRVGEALALRLGDVVDDHLLVRLTKFRKSRLVFLHPSAAAALRRYRRRRQRHRPSSDHFFVSARGKALRYDKVGRAFRALVGQLGLDRGEGRPRPRLHDLRHTFAVRSLERSTASGLSVDEHIVALGTTLGHAHVGSTYWYLHATPELLVPIAAEVDRFLTGEGR